MRKGSCVHYDTVKLNVGLDMTLDDASICTGDSVSLTARSNTPAVTFNWYSDAAYSNLIHTGDTLTTAPLTASVKFYVEVSNGLCSLRDTATVTVLRRAVASDITASDTVICAGSKAVLNASSSNASSVFRWYADDALTSLLYTGNPYTTTSLTRDTVFYATVSNSDLCENLSGTAKPVKVDIDTVDLIISGFTAKTVSLCPDDAVTLVATSRSNSVITWKREAQVITEGLNAQGDRLTIDRLVKGVNDGTYTVEFTSGDCVQTASVSLNIDIDITVDDATVCTGEQLDLVARSNAQAVTFNWYSDAAYSNLIHVGDTLSTAPLMATGKFYVEVSNGQCFLRDTATVTVLSRAVASDITASDTTICAGSKAVLNASSSDASSVFRWYADDAFTSLLHTGEQYTTSTLVRDAVYYVTVSNGNLCENLAGTAKSVNVYVDTADLIVSGFTAKTVSLCPGDFVKLVAASRSNSVKIWKRNGETHTEGLNAQGDTLTIDRLVKGVNDGTYTVEFTSGDCVQTASVSLNIDINVSTENLTVCAGTDVLFTPQTTSAEPLFEWYSDAACTNLIHNENTFSISGLTSDTTAYFILNSGGCKLRDSVKAYVIEPPSVKAIDDRHICFGESVTLAVTQSDGSLSWNVPELTVYPRGTQQYIVTASRAPCPDAHDTLTITSSDSLYISPDRLPVFQKMQEYLQQFESNAENGTFSSADLPAGFALSTTGELSKTSTTVSMTPETFTVTVTDKYGCTVSREYELAGVLFVPEVFSPNNDGINDHFMQGYKVVIFDRLGIKLFEGNDGWDGKHKGKTMAPDTYFYILHYTDENGVEKTATGYIVIL
jgi:gliding motility-associated-like protein